MLNRLRRFGFRLLYNECAFAYDGVSRAVSLGRWRSWQRSVMPFLPEPEAGLILELAQGTGDLQRDLLIAGYRAVALDRSRGMGSLARRKLGRAGLSAKLLRGEAQRLPLRSDSIAAIVCAFPTSFIAQERTLREIRRVLQPGASAVVLLSGMLTDGGWRAKIIQGLYRLTGQSCREIQAAELHSMLRTPGLSLEARALQLDGSLVQIALLTKSMAKAGGGRNHSLDLARET